MNPLCLFFIQVIGKAPGRLTRCAATIEFRRDGKVVTSFNGRETASDFSFRAHAWPRACTIEVKTVPKLTEKLKTSKYCIVINSSRMSKYQKIYQVIESKYQKCCGFAMVFALGGRNLLL